MSLKNEKYGVFTVLLSRLPKKGREGLRKALLRRWNQPAAERSASTAIPENVLLMMNAIESATSTDQLKQLQETTATYGTVPKATLETQVRAIVAAPVLRAVPDVTIGTGSSGRRSASSRRSSTGSALDPIDADKDARIAQLQNENNQLQRDLMLTKQAVENLEKDMAYAQSLLQDEKEKNNQLRTELSTALANPSSSGGVPVEQYNKDMRKQIDQINKLRGENTSLKSKMTQSRDKLNKRIRDLETKLSAARANAQTVSKQLSQAKKDRKDSVDGYVSMVQKLENDLRACNLRDTAEQKKIKKCQQTVKDLKSKLEQSQIQFKQLNDQKTENFEELYEEIDRLGNLTKTQAEELERYREDQVNLMEESEYEEDSDDDEEFKDAINVEDRINTVFEEKMKTVSDKLRNVEDLLDKCKGQSAEKDKTIEKCEEELRKSRELIVELQQEKERSNKKIEELKKENKRMERNQKQDLESAENQEKEFIEEIEALKKQLNEKKGDLKEEMPEFFDVNMTGEEKGPTQEQKDKEKVSLRKSKRKPRKPDRFIPQMRFQYTKVVDGVKPALPIVRIPERHEL